MLRQRKLPVPDGLEIGAEGIFIGDPEGEKIVPRRKGVETQGNVWKKITFVFAFISGFSLLFIAELKHNWSSPVLCYVFSFQSFSILSCFFVKSMYLK